ncbi:MAG: UDP-N-acetylglucosamine 2-epimerase (non-hydrolyzing) [bacterium]|jgi:UDP-N-acetylglucosamine 2-epimerase (non-hydrolysing)
MSRSKLNIISVVGARPNFMKIAPFVRELSRFPDIFTHTLVHTGQHYDVAMSDSFFKELSIPAPDVSLEIGSGTHAEQVGKTMIAFEKVIQARKPDWVIVVGDVNATCACSITTKKEHIRLAHIESGLRSFDLDMPEEINRMVTDRLSDLLFTTDAMADANLLKEGVPADRIKRVGNIMIDSLEAQRAPAAALNLPTLCTAFALPGAHHPAPPLKDNRFCVITLHRPSNVDDLNVLAPLVSFLTDEVAPVIPLIWPVHPRTRKKLESSGLWELLQKAPGIILTQPLGYHEMLRLSMGAKVMLTDSGGLQEECCIWGTPCLTLRWNTERPITLREHGGVSVLVGNDIERIRAEFREAAALPRAPHQPPLWDGHTAERIVACFKELK